VLLNKAKAAPPITVIQKETCSQVANKNLL